MDWCRRNRDRRSKEVKEVEEVKEVKDSEASEFVRARCVCIALFFLENTFGCGPTGSARFLGKPATKFRLGDGAYTVKAGALLPHSKIGAPASEGGRYKCASRRQCRRCLFGGGASALRGRW